MMLKLSCQNNCTEPVQQYRAVLSPHFNVCFVKHSSLLVCMPVWGDLMCSEARAGVWACECACMGCQVHDRALMLVGHASPCSCMGC